MAESVQDDPITIPSAVTLASEPPPPENKIFYPALDGLRAIAVLLVFSHHYIHVGKLLTWGWVGVDIFFVLSGFLITGILYDTRNSPNRFKTFYIRRTLRIFPLYYAVLLVALLLDPVLHWSWDRGWLLWPVYLGNYGRFLFQDYLGNLSLHESMHSTLPGLSHITLQFTHFWSLCLEEQFYLVWPPIVYLVMDRVKLRNLCAVAVIVTPLARLLCVFLLPTALLQGDFLYRFPPLRADALLLGAFVALSLRGPEAGRIRRLAKPLVLTLLAVFAVVFAAIAIITHQAPSMAYNTPWMSTIGFLLLDLFSAGFLLLCLQPKGLLFRILTLSPLRRLGQMSYGFYVYHFLLAGVFLVGARHLVGQQSPLVSAVTAILGMVGTLGISYLSFHYFEMPFLRLKSRFTS